MQNIFLKLLEQLNSSVFVLLGILVLVGWFLYKFGGWVKDHSFHKERIEKIEKKLDLVISLNTKVDLIYKFVNPNAPMRPRSPMSLTAVGIEISKKIRCEEIFNNIKSKFIKEFIEENKTKNAFEIQQNALEWAKIELKSYLSNDDKNIFNNEAYNRGLLPEDIYSILGLYLRDEVLNSLGIDPSEIDKHETLTANNYVAEKH